MSLDELASDEEILAEVEAWIDDLTRGDYEAAFGRTEHDPYYRWTPNLLEAVVNGYGATDAHPSGARFVVTSRSTASGRPHYRRVERSSHPPHGAVEVWYDLPLNGEWSDLTVSFRVEHRESKLHLVLEELHVF